MIKLLRALVGVAIGVVFLWLALRDQNLEDVRAVWASLDASWLLLATAVDASSLMVRIAGWSCPQTVLRCRPSLEEQGELRSTPLDGRGAFDD